MSENPSKSESNFASAFDLIEELRRRDPDALPIPPSLFQSAEDVLHNPPTELPSQRRMPPEPRRDLGPLTWDRIATLYMKAKYQKDYGGDEEVAEILSAEQYHELRQRLQPYHHTRVDVIATLFLINDVGDANNARYMRLLTSAGECLLYDGVASLIRKTGNKVVVKVNCFGNSVVKVLEKLLYAHMIEIAAPRSATPIQLGYCTAHHSTSIADLPLFLPFVLT